MLHVWRRRGRQAAEGNLTAIGHKTFGPRAAIGRVGITTGMINRKYPGFPVAQKSLEAFETRMGLVLRNTFPVMAFWVVPIASSRPDGIPGVLLTDAVHDVSQLPGGHLANRRRSVASR